MRAFGNEVTAGGRGNVGMRMALGTAEDGPYRLRSATDTTWTGHVGYAPRDTIWQKIGAWFGAFLRMILPVLGLLASFVGLYLYRDTPVPLFMDGMRAWLTVGHLLVPVGFFCVHLTNRRYGPTYAFVQVVVASALVVAFIVFAGGDLRPFLPLDSVPSMREAIGLGVAFFLASSVSITVFDGARGAHWWTAPLFGFLSAAIFFAWIFFPIAYAGTGAPWLDHALQYTGVMAGEGILLLLPYWMLRGIVPPLSGFGGY